jgi:hypothetical protein
MPLGIAGGASSLGTCASKDHQHLQRSIDYCRSPIFRLGLNFDLRVLIGHCIYVGEFGRESVEMWFAISWLPKGVDNDSPTFTKYSPRLQL